MVDDLHNDIIALAASGEGLKIGIDEHNCIDLQPCGEGPISMRPN
jgi:hypothetical protein